jgi:hypothetical protein
MPLNPDGADVRLSAMSRMKRQAIGQHGMTLAAHATTARQSGNAGAGAVNNAWSAAEEIIANQDRPASTSGNPQAATATEEAGGQRLSSRLMALQNGAHTVTPAEAQLPAIVIVTIAIRMAEGAAELEHVRLGYESMKPS